VALTGTEFATSATTTSTDRESRSIWQIRDYIYKASGMYFPEHRRFFLESRCKRRMEALGIQSFEEYYRYLTRPDVRRQELQALLNEVTINETSFFRNQPQFDALRHIFLPEIANRKGSIGFKRLKIWSAGCSSGEEPYSIAIVVHELKATLLQGWQIQILGTDINQTVLDKARQGIYTRYSFRNTPPHMISRYFKNLGDGRFELDPAIRRMVEFKNMNLIDEMAILFMKGFDIIFCRNVLIYFDLAAKKHTIQHFYNALLDEGLLFIGHSESLFGVNDQFKMVHFPGGMAYKKTKA